MSYYNNKRGRGGYSGSQRYQPYQKKENQHSSYWASKAFNKQRQEEGYDTNVAERYINGQNHHSYHVEAGTGLYGDFNGEVEDIEEYKKKLYEAFNKIGICDKDEIKY